MAKIQKVCNVWKDIDYTFNDLTATEALEKVIYILNLEHKCNPKICATPSGRTLYFEDRGDTYATINDRFEEENANGLS